MTQITRNLFLLASIGQGGKHLHGYTHQLTEIVASSALTAAFSLEHIKHIHLFGDCTPEKKQIISSSTLSFGIVATFERGKDEY